RTPSRISMKKSSLLPITLRTTCTPLTYTKGPAPRRWSAVRTEGARPPRATAAVVGAARKAPWRAAPVTRCVVTAPPSPESRLRGWRRNSTGRTTYPGHGDVSWRPP
ncbi:LOW QUALITY PROTEIN: EVX1 isoform 3, partial [Pongo abelii]